jgi:hypothetical protein
MSKTKINRSTTKTSRRITKASTSKTSATKTSAPLADDIGLLVLGFDEQQKPCGARFIDAKPDLVAKAAQLMGLKVYKPSSPEAAELAKKLPVGQLYATGRAFVPHVRQSLYSDIIVALAAEPQQAAVGPDDDKASTPVARGLPRSWDEIAPGHAREPRLRVVGGDRARPQRRHAHAPVSRLPAAPQVLSPPHRRGVDESCQRSVNLGGKPARAAKRGPSPLPASGPASHTFPTILEVQSWTQRLRASAR